MTKDASLSWVAGTGAGGQIGVWGNGSQYVYVGHNPATLAVDVFISNAPNLTTSNGFDLKLLAPLYVESNAFKYATHLSKQRKIIYDVDWSTPINPVTTAGGGLIAVGVPVYPNLMMDVFCSSGHPQNDTTVSIRFSRNSANSTPAISQPASWISGFDGDTCGHFTSTSTESFFTPWKGELITSTAQFRVLRVGNFYPTTILSYLPTAHISGYSWSK